MKDDVNNRNTAFRRLYKVHEIIADLNERVISLYSSATYASPKIDGMPKAQPNPHRFENTMVKIMELQDKIDDLLQQRVNFDTFILSLAPTHSRLLKMRFEDNFQWKEIASDLDISTDTVKRTFKRICDKAEKAGLFDTPKE